MGLLDNMRIKRNIRKSDKLLKQAKNQFDNAETKEQGIEIASEKAIAAMEAYSNSEGGAIKVLEKIQEGELPAGVKLNTVIQIPSTNLENEIITEAVEKLNFTSEEIRKILREAGEYIDTKEAIKIIKQIPDEKIREEECERLKRIEKARKEKEKREREEKKNQEENNKKEKLRSMYACVDKIPISILVYEINNIVKDTKIIEFQQMVRRILARKAAVEMKRIGSVPINTIKRIIPTEEMMKRFPTKLTGDKQEDLNFIELIEIEYDDIKEVEFHTNSSRKMYDFDKIQLERLLLQEIAKEVVDKFNKTGVILVPQSDSMRELDDEQIEFFIRKIQIRDEEGKINSEEVINQVKGIQRYKEKDWLNLINKLTERQKKDSFEFLLNQIENGEDKNLLDPRVKSKLEEVAEKLKKLKPDEAIELIELLKEEIETNERETLIDEVSGLSTEDINTSQKTER